MHGIKTNNRYITTFAVIIVFVVAIFCSACNRQQEHQILKNIDSLITTSQNYLVKLDSINIDSILQYYSEIKNNNKILVEKLHGLPANTGMKNKLLQMGSIEKGIKKIPDKVNYFKNEINFSIGQLNALKTDIENNILKEEEYRNYYNDELEAVNSFTSELDKLLKITRKNISNYKNIMPDIRIYIDSLKKT